LLPRLPRIRTRGRRLQRADPLPENYPVLPVSPRISAPRRGFCPLRIKALSFRFSTNSLENGPVLPWPPRLNRFVKLYFLVQLTIAARYYPRRIFECAAKLLASAFAQQQPGFTLAALNSAAKRAPRSDSLEAGSVLSLPFPLRESRSFSSQFNSVDADSVLPVPPSQN
jgi:hypothetical protein